MIARLTGSSQDKSSLGGGAVCKVDIMSDEDRQWSAPPAAARPATPGADGPPASSPPAVTAPAGSSSDPVWARPAGQDATGPRTEPRTGPFPPAFQGSPGA